MAALGLVAFRAALALGGPSGRVPRNVSLAGMPVGGMTATRVHQAVHELALRYASATVQVRAPGGGLSATGAELGLHVDEAASVEAALRTRAGGGAVTRAWRALLAVLGRRSARARVDVDTGSVYDVVTSRDSGPREPAVEPGIAARGGKLVAVDGTPGRGISPAEVAAELRRLAAAGRPLAVRAHRDTVEPRFRLADAQRLVPEGERMTAAPLPVQAGDTRADVPVEVQRKWLRAFAGDHSLSLGIDEDAAMADLPHLLAGATTEPVDATFTVKGDSVTVVPDRPGAECCAPAAAERVAAALGDRPGADDPVELPLRSVPAHRTADDARRLGIQERVSSFTTHHKPGEPRVHNIHRIADLVRGSVIPRGGTFSINGSVGPRTADKGFVEAPVIDENNKYSSGVGGGVSQFATTMFNAAFFAGLDVPEYSAHGLYISRYPFGREATLSFPHPDLVIRNPSPYGVLVWTSYTDTDITVTLYSTHWADADQTGQTVTEKPAKPAPDRDPTLPPLGPCQSVTTERTRWFASDGHSSVDHFYALYRPEEGASCA